MPWWSTQMKLEAVLATPPISSLAVPIVCCTHARQQAAHTPHHTLAISYVYPPDSKQMMDVLVTGGTGFVSKATNAELLRRHPSCRVHILSTPPREGRIRSPQGAFALTPRRRRTAVRRNWGHCQDQTGHRRWLRHTCGSREADARHPLRCSIDFDLPLQALRIMVGGRRMRLLMRACG